MHSESRAAMVLPFLVGGALLMENVDSTVIATSLPAMARTFGQNPIALKVGLTAYIVALGVFIPVSGWLADRFGGRSVFRTAIGVFTLGSLLCAVVPNFDEFIVARFIQGIGGALMVPVGRVVIFRTIPKAQYVRAVSYLTIPSLLGPVLGPPLGGFITTYASWRWIFGINVPIAVCALYLTGRFMPALKEPVEAPLDRTGFVLSAVGASLFLLGPSLIDTPYLTDQNAYLMTLAGFVTLCVYGRHARRTVHPLLDLTLLKTPTFRASVLGGSLFRVALGSIPFLLPLSLQLGLGMTPFESGALTCFSAFGSLIMKWLATRALRRFGFRDVLVYNAVLVALTIVMYGAFTPSTPHAVIALTVLVAGVFPSLQFTSINAIAYADIAPADVGRATSLASTVQQISLGMGITIGGIVLHAVGALEGHAEVHYADFQATFAVMAFFSLASIYFNRRLDRDAGAELAARARAVRRAA